MPVRSSLLPSRNACRWGVLAGMAILLSGCESALVAPGAESIVGTSAAHAPAATGTPATTPFLNSGSTIAEPAANPHALQAHTLCAALQSHAMLNITLLFGQSRPHGKAISASEWQGFVKNTLTPAFPSGLSVLSAQGQWQNPATGQITHEPARLVMILTEPTQDVATRLQTIRSRYKEQFQQQSVGVVVAPACVGF